MFFIIEVERSEGNFFRQITEAQLKNILATDDGDAAREIIVDYGNRISVNSLSQVDLYFGYPEDWKEVKQEWLEYLADE